MYVNRPKSLTIQHNHTDKKKDEASIKFKNDFIKRYDRRSNQYIIDFEGIFEEKEKNDDLNNFNAKMKTFVLNAIFEFSFFKVENSETFFISFGALQDAEVMTINFNQRAFKHELGIISIEFLNQFQDSETSDPFAYVVSDRYISDEFYGIMIDTDVSKYLIVDYGQYLAYKAINDDATINFIKTEAIYVQFGIGSISSIKFINIAILLIGLNFT